MADAGTDQIKDSKQSLDNAKEKVRAVEQAMDLIAQGKTLAEIQKVSGLSEEEIKELRGDY